MVETSFNRWRRIIAVAAAMLALADIAIIVALITGFATIVRLGFRLVQPHDVPGAAQLATILCALVVVSAWPQRIVRSVAIVATIAMLLVALAAGAGSAQRRVPVGDHALLESYTLLATQGKLLVGPYSRFGWHHPGPLYFWLAAPFYALANYHTGGLAVAVLLINAASIATTVWIAARFASAPLLVALLVAMTGYVWRIDGIFMSLWNPYVPVLPALGLAIICAAVAAGHAGLVPLAVLFASFAAQTHVGLLPYAAAVMATAIAACIVGSRRELREWLDPRTRRILNASAWLLVLLWIGPIAEQLSGDTGNLTQLWRFFASDHPRPTFTAAYVAWANNISAPLTDFRLPMHHFSPLPSSWPLVWAATQTLLLVPTVLWLRATGRRFDAALAAIVLTATVVSLWSVTRIVDGIIQYGIVWISAVGVLGTAVLAGTGLMIVDMRTAALRRLPARTPALVVMLFVCVLAAETWRTFDGSWQGTAEPARREQEARALYDGLQPFLRDAQVRKPLLRMSTDTWAAAAAVGLQFQLAGRDFAVDPAAVGLFTEAFRADGTEDVEITISTRARHREMRSRPGNVTVATSGRVYADAIFLSTAVNPAN